jgi:FKBP-type peptidyl-prolyl cis-trans isomerase FkpA
MSDIALAKGEKFLEDNAKKEGVTVTASGLQYKVITEGTGKSPKATDTVEVHYEGTLIDGKVFDSSYKRKETIEFPLNRVIAGWTEGVQLMQEGAKYPLLHPLQARLRPPWCRSRHRPERGADLRRGADQGEVIHGAFAGGVGRCGDLGIDRATPQDATWQQEGDGGEEEKSVFHGGVRRDSEKSGLRSMQICHGTTCARV